MYQLKCVIEVQKLELFQLTNKLRAFEIENKQLKQNIEILAIENSHHLDKPKRRLSQEIINRWKYYHEHKKEVASKYKLYDWRLVKTKCDKLFASSN